MTRGAHASGGCRPRDQPTAPGTVPPAAELGKAASGAGQGLILPSGTQLGPEPAHPSRAAKPRTCSTCGARQRRPALAQPLWLSPVSFGQLPFLACARAWAAVLLGDRTGLTGVGRESCLAEMPRAGTQPLNSDGHPAQRPRGASGAEHGGESFTLSSLLSSLFLFSPPVCPAVPALAPAQQPGHRVSRHSERGAGELPSSSSPQWLPLPAGGRAAGPARGRRDTRARPGSKLPAASARSCCQRSPPAPPEPALRSRLSSWCCGPPSPTAERSPFLWPHRGPPRTQHSPERRGNRALHHAAVCWRTAGICAGSRAGASPPQCSCPRRSPLASPGGQPRDRASRRPGAPERRRSRQLEPARSR